MTSSRILYFSREYTTHDRRFLETFGEMFDVVFLRLEDEKIGYERRHLPAHVSAVSWELGLAAVGDLDAWFDRMRDLERILDQVRPDLTVAGPLHSCGAMAALAGARPLAVMSWASDVLVLADSAPRWRWLIQRALRSCDLMFSDSGVVTERALGLGLDPAKVRQFPWGVDVGAFRPEGPITPIRQREGWADAVIVIATRTWKIEYGIDVAIDAFARARAVEPRLRMVLLGTGPDRGSVLERIEKDGIRDAVWAPGMVAAEELPDHFRAADVYLSCTPSDGSSISMLEAMASGLPVVVADSRGDREWIDERGGWLVPPRDVAGFARALVSAARLDSEQRGRMATRNREEAIRSADWAEHKRTLLGAVTAALRARP